MLSYLLIGAAVGLVNARVDPPANGALGACHGEACDDCPTTASINEGYPSCLIYPSTGNLDGFEASSGNGYDVWWNSGDPNPGCKIIVRTPASTDVPECGYFLRDWSVGGCYYTAIQESFMLQYCCGSGDCDAAEPSKQKRSIAEVHAAHLVGETAMTSMVFSNFNHTLEGTEDFGLAGSVKWRRQPSSGTQKAQVARAEDKLIEANEYAREKTAAVVAASSEKRCDDAFDLASEYTSGGEQSRVSPTQNCNVSGGCAIEISSSVTTGYSVSFSVGVNIEVFEASLSTTFEKSETHSLSFTFNQDQGTTGYVSFIPTYDCYRGTYHSCKDGDADGYTCNPRLIGEGDSQTQDGTYSFVYT